MERKSKPKPQAPLFELIRKNGNWSYRKWAGTALLHEEAENLQEIIVSRLMDDMYNEAMAEKAGASRG